MSAVLNSLRSYQAPTAASANLREIAKEQGNLIASVKRGDRPTHTTATRTAPVTPKAAPAAQKTIPAVTYAQVDALGAQVDEGYYALPRNQASAAGNDITFFQVRALRNGNHQIRQVIGGPGGWQYQTLPAKFQYVAFLHILDNADAARMLFATEKRACYLCKSPLSDAHSRAVGMGPDCEKK